MSRRPAGVLARFATPPDPDRKTDKRYQNGWFREAGVLVDAWRRVGAPAVAECDAAVLEMAEELFPLGVGGGAVFRAGAELAAAGDECLVAAGLEDESDFRQDLMGALVAGTVAAVYRFGVLVNLGLVRQ